MKSIPWIILLALFLVVVQIHCHRRKDKVEVVQSGIDYRREGDSIIQLTFDSLRAALSRAISNRGLAAAVDYCQVQAPALTSAYATREVSVRRSSLQFRNPLNAPDSLESAVIHRMAEMKSLQKTPLPELVETGEGIIHYFKPILVQTLCLNCHGAQGTQVTAETASRIRALYPEDKAMGYREGDLRGAWHIRFQPGYRGNKLH